MSEWFLWISESMIETSDANEAPAAQVIQSRGALVPAIFEGEKQ